MTTPPPGEGISEPLLLWFAGHGRRTLPWQHHPTPYRVWVSEIMLQQTRVTAVVDYYQRFMEHFPEVRDLARADLDAVLSLWAGLGYYARARNLHRTAKFIWNQYGGLFPLDLRTLQALPGIGRSTAGAILALACGQRQPILDGNVKRVLTRLHALPGWPGHSQVERELWRLAEHYTPTTRVAEYTQAIMDLGATVCTRTHPACSRCPLQSRCQAHAEGQETAYPTPRTRRAPALRRGTFIILYRSDGSVLLEKRPPAGIWGGLWSLPECPPEISLHEWCQGHLGYLPVMEHLPSLRHGFTHFTLHILPVLVPIEHPPPYVMDTARYAWYDLTSPSLDYGLPAPVARLLSRLQTERPGK